MLAGLAWFALYRYHKRRDKELEQRYAVLEGWARTVLSVRQEVWVCPDCGAVMLSWQGVHQHQGVTSPCGVLAVELREREELDRARAAAREAETSGRWNVSATVGGEEHRGAVDTFTAGELEGARDDG